MNSCGFYAITFVTTSHVIQTEKLAVKEFSTSIIPTPREISKSCGLAIRINLPEDTAIVDFMNKLAVPVRLFYLGDRQSDGKRDFRLIYEKNNFFCKNDLEGIRGDAS